MLARSILDIVSPSQITRLASLPSGDIRPGQLVMLPEHPIGDIDEEGDYDTEVGDMEGDIEYLDEGDTEMGAPRRKKIKAGRLAGKLATNTANSSQKRAARSLAQSSPRMARSVGNAARAKALAQNRHVEFEHVKGGRIVASDLGVGARLRPTEVTALKSAIHLSTPFSPRVFTFTAGTLDIAQSLNSVIGTSTILYAGILITLAASTLNINQGAIITIVRHLTTVNASIQQVSNTIELDSGVAAVEILLLNGLQVAGKPRFWAPQVAGNAVAQADTDIDITGLPANYTATARFLQPGDHQVEKFLQGL